MRPMNRRRLLIGMLLALGIGDVACAATSFQGIDCQSDVRAALLGRRMPNERVDGRTLPGTAVAFESVADDHRPTRVERAWRIDDETVRFIEITGAEITCAR